MKTVLTFVLLFVIHLATAQTLDAWIWRNPQPQGNALRGSTYANGLWAMTGDKGSIVFSGGSALAARTSGVTDNLGDIAYGAGRWVVVAENGRILVSEDGLSWRAITVSPGVSFARLLYNNSIFVLVSGYAASGTVLFTSADGLSWTQVQNPGIYGSVGAALVCGGSFYLYSSDSYSATISVSANGVTWGNKYASYFSSLACKGSTLVGAGSKFGTSTDGGTTWTMATDYSNARQVACSASLCVAATDTAILISSDATTWSTASSQLNSSSVNQLAYGGNAFVAIGNAGAINTSADGVTWSALTTGGNDYFSNVAYGKDTFVVAGSGSNPAQANQDTLRYSSDYGQTWQAVKSGAFYGMSFVNDRFVAVGHSGTIMYSLDGKTWTDVSDPLGGSLYGVAYGNCVYVITGGNNAGVVYRSYDGAHWSKAAITPYPSSFGPWGLFEVAFGNGLFVAGGSGWDGSKWTSVILTSPDGLIWTPQTLGNDFSVTSLTFGNGVFLALAGTVYSSSDGKTWTQASTTSANKVRFSGGQFLTPSYSGQLASSTDGRNWADHQLPTTSVLYDFAWGKDGYVAVGDGGAILQGSRAAACYQVTPTQAAALWQGSGGVATLTQGAGLSCSWTASTQTPWLAATPASGSGNGGLSWQAASSNTCTHARYGTIEAAGERIAVSQPPSDADRVFNWVEALFPTYLAPAGQASQALSGFYLRYYPATNQAFGTIGQDTYYYDGVSVVKLPDPLQTYLYGAIQAGF
ncbi:MAG: hypothetical protein WCV99_06720 [Sterolibacterium sp.]